MKTILRSAARGLLWGVVLASGALVTLPAEAGGWRDRDGWRHDDGYRDAGWHDGRHGGDDHAYGDGYGYGYGDGYRYGHGDDRDWRRDGRWHGGQWGDRGYRDGRGGSHGRVWCPQRRAYVLPWEARGWRGDRNPRWRHRERRRHWPHH